MKRVYHPIDLWEELPAGMWATVSDRKAHLKRAIAFTSDHKKYGRFMLKVAIEWPFSCENALTDKKLNRKAWIGHAACAMAIGCPEDITREAWGHLTESQRELANREADRVIRAWEFAYESGGDIRKNMEGALL